MGEGPNRNGEESRGLQEQSVVLGERGGIEEEVHDARIVEVDDMGVELVGLELDGLETRRTVLVDRHPPQRNLHRQTQLVLVQAAVARHTPNSVHFIRHHPFHPLLHLYSVATLTLLPRAEHSLTNVHSTLHITIDILTHPNTLLIYQYAMLANIL